MKKFIKYAAITLAGIPILFYTALYAFDVESKVIYEPTAEMLPVLASLKDKVQTKSFKTKEGINLNYWYIKGNKNLPAILYCHGNAENLTHFQERIKFLADNNYRVFMLDYRGYGNSGGKPTEEGLYSDTELMVEHVNKQFGIANNDLIIWGHSLGGAVVADVTSRIDFKGVILEGTFTRLEDMRNYAAEFRSSNKAEETFRKFVYNLIPLTQKFETIDKVNKISSPLFLIHSEKDEIIPYEMNKQLAQQNPDAIQCLSKEGLHDGTKWNNEYILNFIRSLN